MTEVLDDVAPMDIVVLRQRSRVIAITTSESPGGRHSAQLEQAMRSLRFSSAAR